MHFRFSSCITNYFVKYLGIHATLPFLLTVLYTVDVFTALKISPRLSLQFILTSALTAAKSWQFFFCVLEKSLRMYRRTTKIQHYSAKCFKSWAKKLKNILGPRSIKRTEPRESAIAHIKRLGTVGTCLYSSVKKLSSL